MGTPIAINNKNYTWSAFTKSADTNNDGKISESERANQVNTVEAKIKAGTATQDDVNADVVATNLLNFMSDPNNKKYLDKDGNLDYKKLQDNNYDFNTALGGLKGVDESLVNHLTNELNTPDGNKILTQVGDTLSLSA